MILKTVAGKHTSRFYMLLLKGDPTQDISLLQLQDKLALIMKDGVVYNNTTAQEISS